MYKVHALRQRKADLIKEAGAIFEAAQGRAMTAEEKTRDDAIETELAEVNDQIARAERQMEREALQGGTALTPAVTGATPTVAAEPKAEKPKFASFGEQLQAVANACMSNQTGRTIELSDGRSLIWGAATGANEAVPSEGGFLVQTDFSTALLALMHELGDIIGLCRDIPLSAGSNGIKLPMIDESARTDGSRWGGVQAYWANEADTVTGTKPKFRQVELNLHKLFGLGYATEELLRDAAALGAIMTQAFGEELTFKAENAIVNGTGAGQPLGIVNSGALITIAKESSQTAATVVTANILKMWARMPLRSRKSAVWLINQDVEMQLYPLVLVSGDGTTRLYTPPGVNGNNGPFGLLMGRPVIPVEYCATLGAAGDILLVDPQQYLTIGKDSQRAESSMHVRFLYDEMTFRFIHRIDGQPAWNKPVTPFKGTNTLSPFVALAERA